MITLANSEASPIERLEKLDKVITQNYLGAETHVRAWALKETVIKDYLEKIDSKRQQYLANCYIDIETRILEKVYRIIEH